VRVKIQAMVDMCDGQIYTDRQSPITLWYLMVIRVFGSRRPRYLMPLLWLPGNQREPLPL